MHEYWRGVREERARIGCELHDGLLPHLQVAALRLQLALDLLCDGEASPSAPCVDAQRELLDVQKSLRILGQEARGWLGDQPPAEVAATDLETVFRGIVARFQAAEGSACRVRLDLADDLPPLCAHSRWELACIGLEAMRNAVRHGRAQTVEVRLEHLRAECWVRLQVRDDGVGFDPAAVPAGAGGGAHFGLRAMRMRAERLGGQLTMMSQPGRGTTVTSITPDTPRSTRMAPGHPEEPDSHLDH